MENAYFNLLKQSRFLKDLFTKKYSSCRRKQTLRKPAQTHAENHMSASQAVKSTVREKGNAYIHLCYTRKVLV